MSSLLICPLSQLESQFRASGADEVVTMMSEGTFEVPILPARRALRLEFSDIAVPTQGHTLPGVEHLAALLRFAAEWDQRRPLLIHCYAGVSRSTAAAFVIACALRPEVKEMDVAQRLRRRSLSATPNPRIVAIADAMLDRSGRMIEAVAAIGRGAECFEGAPFSFELDD